MVTVFDKRGDKPARRVRVEDVARLAGVSPITVSRALSNPEKVRAETRERVEAAVARTGYVVNTMASNLRSGRSSIVAMFVETLENAETNQAIQGVSDVLARSGFHLLMGRTDADPAGQAASVAAVAPLRPAGIIMGGVVRDKASRAALRAIGSPVVELGDESETPFDMLAACSNHQAGRLMGEHFVERGFQRVAYIGARTQACERRLEGFRAALAASAVDLVHVDTARRPDSPADGAAAWEGLQRACPQVEAVFVADSQLAAGMALRAERAAYGRPAELAVFGTVPLEAVLSQPLTAVKFSNRELGRAAAHLLLRRLQGRESGTRLALVPPHLHTGAATPDHRHAAE